MMEQYSKVLPYSDIDLSIRLPHFKGHAYLLLFSIFLSLGIDWAFFYFQTEY